MESQSSATFKIDAVRFLLSALLVFGLGFAVSAFLPWWSVVVLSFFVAGILNRNGFLAFLSAFIGVFLLWAGQAFVLDGADAVLSSRLAGVFSLPSGLGVIALTGLVAALPSAFAGLAGSFLFDVFMGKSATPEASVEMEKPST